MTTYLYGNRAQDGVTEFVLTAQKSRLVLHGQEVELSTYNGSFPGPTLRAFAGQRVRILFQNNLSEATNLHLHGMHMPPSVDDPHRVVKPGESTSYEFSIPEDGAGVYWYHPHFHGEVARQLGEGLAGAMLVSNRDDAATPLRGAQERVLVFQDLTLDGTKPALRTALELHDGREGELVFTSGACAPRLEFSSGLVRLYLVNASSARFYRVALEGAKMHLIGIDAARLERPEMVEEILLPPGQRADVLICADTPSTLTLKNLPFDRGTTKLPGRKIRLPNEGILASLSIQGPARDVTLPVLSSVVERLNPADAVATRRLLFGGQGNMWRFIFAALSKRRYRAGEGNQGPARFWINGKEFAPDRIDIEAQLNTTEIWELVNPTPMHHPFHLHIYPFQVLEVNGEAPSFLAWRDVINVPAKGSVKIAIPFRDFAGVTMFHCHILEHEDNGMMAHLLIKDGDTPVQGCHSQHTTKH